MEITAAQDTTAQLAPVWREVLSSAHDALREVIARVDAGQWQLATPCADWNVAQVAEHAAGDQRAFAAALGVGAGPAYDPFSPTGTIADGPVALVTVALEETATAWSTVTDDTESVPTPLPFGPLPTPVAAVLCALDAAVHAWDIAVATGQESPLTDELCAPILAAAQGRIEPLRDWGAYGPIVEGEGSSTDRLLRYLGRRPQK
ncbi:TIGR03086 family metal-binding protein [Nocardia testacea]|uniref:TIGR03086 family metal-binding protein n=1 Tax=Nocardia testacea TaxID=248551 RepID=UPI000313924B|nr:TIGR03086 family metal-binding protein [Nocardia testacea]